MKLSKITQQPTITAERFDLRPLQKSDAGVIHQLASDARIAKMTSNIPHPYPEGAAEVFVARTLSADRSEHVWAIDGTKDAGSEVMGMISLNQMDRDQSEVGYWIAPAFWNTGLASEAVNALIEANPLANKTLFASVFQDNPASAAVLTHAGFDYIGNAETFSVARDAHVATWTYLRKLA